MSTAEQESNSAPLAAVPEGSAWPPPDSERSTSPPAEEGRPTTLELAPERNPDAHRLRFYSHSSLFYWWPVWVLGYVMAVITYWEGHGYQLGQSQTWVHPSSNPGLIFFLVLFLVIVISNFSVRGLASGMVVMAMLLLAVLFAYFGWWDEIFTWFGSLSIHLNLGAYFWFSTLMLGLWGVSVFVLDRTNYWEVTPGQLTHVSLFGGGSRSYNAQGMGLEKHRDDLFRHWLLGLGSGDLRIRTSGATHAQIDVVNVLFIGAKIDLIQTLISEVPEGDDPS